MAWLLLQLRGRVSRKVYWLSYAMILAVQAILLRPLMHGLELVLSGSPEAAPLWPDLALFATVYCHLAVSVKRLHDAGYGGFLAAALFVPIVQLVFTVWVGLLPGTVGPNKFGEVEDQPA